VYYGAFETLGHPREVSQMNMKDRNAPVLDLSGFVSLLDWASAAGDFLRHGSAGRLKTLTA